MFKTIFLFFVGLFGWIVLMNYYADKEAVAVGVYEVDEPPAWVYDPPVPGRKPE